MGDGDAALYADVADKVRNGESYYDAIAKLHRERRYPLTPVVTVRPPALAHMSAALGPQGLRVVAWLLLLGILVVWHRALKNGSMWERVAVLCLLGAGGATLIGPVAVQVHEFWAGMLITAALGLSWSPRMQIAAATLAALVRELALPLMGLLLYPFSRHRGVTVGIGLIVIALYYIFHAMAVQSVLLPGDHPSQGWFGMRGLAGLTDDLSELLSMSVPVWAALLPLVGWLYYARRDPVPFLWCLGVIGAVCIVARPDNLFWIVMMFPLYTAGLAFVGTMLADGYRVVRRRS